MCMCVCICVFMCVYLGVHLELLMHEIIAALKKKTEFQFIVSIICWGIPP